MKAIPYLLSLAIASMSFNAFGQHHENHDTAKSVVIEEVLITSQIGVDKKLEKQQRASKQANIDKLLDRVSGLQMIRIGVYALEPSIRSMSASQINLSIDGMAIFGACTDRMDPVSSYIEPSNLQVINVNLGPSFNNYGGGIAGGINFKLASPELSQLPKLNGMLGTGFETNSNALQTLASLQYSTEKYGILVNGIFRKAENYKASNNMVVQNSQFQKWNGSIAFNYKLNKKNRILAQYLADYGQNIGYPALTMDVAYANANIASITHTYSPTVIGLSDIRTKFYFNHIDHAMDDTKRPAESVAMHMDMPGLSWTGGFFSESAYEKGKHYLQARMSGYINRLTANMTMYPDEGSPMFMYTLPDVQRSFISLDISDKILTSEHGGLDFMGTYNFAHSGVFSRAGEEQLSSMNEGSLNRQNHLGNLNLTGHYHLNSNLHWMLKLGASNRAASLQEYYGFYLFNRQDNYDYVGNIDLKTEKALQVSLGASYQLPWIRVEATAYNYYFKDYIAGVKTNDYGVMSIGASGVKQYDNLPNANIKGLEFAFQLKPISSLEWISSIAYSEGKDNMGNPLPLIAPLSNNNSLLLTIKEWTGQFDVNYYAPQNKVSPEVYGDTPSPSATLLNAQIRRVFSLKNHRITANLRVENLFDRYYYRHQDIMKIARPGRNFISQITVSF